jgi:serpin B
VLVNAIYIKSTWKYPFNKERTADKDFLNISGEKVKKKFMTQQKSNIPYYEQEDFIAIELPYTTQELSLILIRPNDKRVQSIADFVPDAGTYMEIVHNLRPESVKMEIPLFKIESEFSLSNELKQAGIEQAFDNRADFSGITNKKDLSISDVFQKVFFEIDEEGSEAAAATGIVMVTTSMPVDPPQFKEFIADRPFLFILKENRFNTPLFVGQFVK